MLTLTVNRWPALHSEECTYMGLLIKLSHGNDCSSASIPSGCVVCSSRHSIAGMGSLACRGRVSLHASLLDCWCCFTALLRQGPPTAPCSLLVTVACATCWLKYCCCLCNTLLRSRQVNATARCCQWCKQEGSSATAAAVSGCSRAGDTTASTLQYNRSVKNKV
jgi:hypothetical protein